VWSIDTNTSEFETLASSAVISEKVVLKDEIEDILADGARSESEWIQQIFGSALEARSFLFTKAVSSSFLWQFP
jgi:hypothetical protein